MFVLLLSTNYCGSFVSEQSVLLKEEVSFSGVLIYFNVLDTNGATVLEIMHLHIGSIKISHAYRTVYLPYITDKDLCF